MFKAKKTVNALTCVILTLSLISCGGGSTSSDIANAANETISIAENYDYISASESGGADGGFSHSRYTALGKLLLRANYQAVTTLYGEDPIYDPVSYSRAVISACPKLDCYHTGADYRARTPLSIYSPINGTVVSAPTPKQGSNSGEVVVLDDITKSHFMFLHLSSHALKINDYVTVGCEIGKTGNTHAYTGPMGAHLHVELRSQNLAPSGFRHSVKELLDKGNASPLRILDAYDYSVSDINNNIGLPSTKACTGSSQPTPLPTPINLVPGGNSNDTATILPNGINKMSWDSISGATYYNIALRDLSTYKLIIDQKTNNNYITLPTLNPSTNFRWNVQACNSSSCSPISLTKYFNTPAPSLNPPINTKPTLSNFTINGELGHAFGSIGINDAENDDLTKIRVHISQTYNGSDCYIDVLSSGYSGVAKSGTFNFGSQINNSNCGTFIQQSGTYYAKVEAWDTHLQADKVDSTFTIINMTPPLPSPAEVSAVKGWNFNSGQKKIYANFYTYNNSIIEVIGSNLPSTAVVDVSGLTCNIAAPTTAGNFSQIGGYSTTPNQTNGKSTYSSNNGSQNGFLAVCNGQFMPSGGTYTITIKTAPSSAGGTTIGPTYTVNAVN